MMSRRQAFAALAAMLPAENAPAANDEKPDVEKLVKMWADALRHLRLAIPPIGSVQAFAGDWPPRKANGAWTELEIGWLLCDGRKIDEVQAKLHEELEKLNEPIPTGGGILAELREVLPRLESGERAVSLPDYRGMFLRGVDCGTDGKSTGNDKDGNRPVGKLQGFATAMPQGKDKAFRGC